jgi:polysaccharide export outer membrane protein
VPVKGLIEKADPELNLRLTGGEEIRVPEAGRVYVVGNVKKPGAFSIHEASEGTVLQMLALAEGLLPYATKQAYIYRRDPLTQQKKEVVVDLRQIIDRKSPDSPVLPGDILYIPDNRARRASMTAVERIVGFGASTVSGLLIFGAR